MFDSPMDRHRRRKRSTLTWWLLIAIALVLAALPLYRTFGPNPPIVVSKETTYLTEPLKADGTPDYAAVLIEELREGVTPENNGAVLLLEAMWPQEEEVFVSLTDRQAAALFKELGAVGPPFPDRRITPIGSLSRRRMIVRMLQEQIRKAGPAEDIDRVSRLTDQEFLDSEVDQLLEDDRVEYVLAMLEPVSRRWNEDRLPYMADWVAENSDAIDRLVEAVARPRWYLPDPAWFGPEFGVLSVFTVMLERNAARALVTRCNLRRGQGKYGEAVQDALAISKLASHVADEPFLVHQLVAVAIDGVACDTINRLAADPESPPTSLRRLLEEHRQLGEIGRFEWSLATGERYFWIATALMLLQSEPDELVGRIAKTRYDPNVVLRHVVDVSDKAALAFQMPDWRGRRDAIFALDQQMEADWMASEQLDPWRLLTVQSRSEVAAGTAVGALVANLTAMANSRDRASLNRDLTRLTVALAIHRAEQGAYPKFLDELVPGVLVELPVDLFHEQPYVYRRTDDGFLLYSCGPNGIDDGGSNEGSEGDGDGLKKFEGIEIDAMLTADPDRLSPEEERAYELIDQIPAGADDYSIRVPLPVEPWPWERATSDAEASEPAPLK